MNGDNGEVNETPRPGVDWNDPDVPAGDSPPLPAWPVLVAGALWGGCVIFLVVTAISG